MKNLILISVLSLFALSCSVNPSFNKRKYTEGRFNRKATSFSRTPKLAKETFENQETKTYQPQDSVSIQESSVAKDTTTTADIADTVIICESNPKKTQLYLPKLQLQQKARQLSGVISLKNTEAQRTVHLETQKTTRAENKNIGSIILMIFAITFIIAAIIVFALPGGIIVPFFNFFIGLALLSIGIVLLLFALVGYI